jgi:hypothetical protein
LFSDSLFDSANRVVNLYFGLAADSSLATCDGRHFLADAARYMTYRLKLEVSGAKPEQWNRFVPISITAAELDRMGTVEYYKRNYQAWLNERPSNRP